MFKIFKSDKRDDQLSNEIIDDLKAEVLNSTMVIQIQNEEIERLKLRIREFEHPDLCTCRKGEER